jgi:hypothetical protein
MHVIFSTGDPKYGGRGKLGLRHAGATLPSLSAALLEKRTG